MSISCDCSAQVDDVADVYRQEFPKARKTYKCCECREKEAILPGQEYHKVTMLYDGIWSEYKTCMPCYNIRERYCPYGYYFEGLRETIESCLGFDYTEVPESEEDEEE